MADLISSGKVIQKPEIVVEPEFFLPGGIVGTRSRRADERTNPNDGYQYSGDAWSSSTGTAPGETEGETIEEVTDGTGDGDSGPGGGGGGTGGGGGFPGTGSGALLVPTNFKVISQEAKFSADGTMTYDVTIEFDDIPGVDGYDIRVTKAGEVEGTVIPVNTAGEVVGA